jgi:hypothetical protein
VCKFNRATMLEEWAGKAKDQETLLQAIGRAASESGYFGVLVLKQA